MNNNDIAIIGGRDPFSAVGGIEVHCRRLAEAVDRHIMDARVYLLTCGGSSGTYVARRGRRIIQINVGANWGVVQKPQACFFWFLLLLRVRPGVIHVNGSGSSSLVILAKVFLDALVLYTKHDIGKAKRGISTARWVAHLVAEAPTCLADRKYSVFHDDHPEFELCTLPTSLPQPEDIDSATSLFRVHGFAPGGYIICCGRLTREKGAIDVVAAYAEAQISMPLVLVGAVSSELRQFIKSFLCYESTSNIILLGEQQHEVCLGLISQAGYFVSGSHYEAFGLAVYEAKASGTRAVLSRIPAHERAFGSRAHYFAAGNVGELTNLFQQLKSLDAPVNLITPEMRLATEASWQKLILRLYTRVSTTLANPR